MVAAKPGSVILTALKGPWSDGYHPSRGSIPKANVDPRWFWVVWVGKTLGGFRMGSAALVASA